MLASKHLSLLIDQQVAQPSGWVVMLGTLSLFFAGLCAWLIFQRSRQVQPDRLRLLSLGRMGQSVTSSLRLNEVLQQILEQITLLIGAEGVAILLLDGDEFEFVAVSGSAAAGLDGYRMPADAGVAGQVAQTKRPISVTGQTGRAQIYQQAEQVSGYESQTLLAVPLQVGDVFVGILEAVHSQENGFSADDLQTLEDAANWAALAIQNARLYEQAMAELQERQRAELSLRESEHRYRTLAEVSPVGIFRLDSAGNYLYANGRWSEISQMAFVQAQGRNWLDGLALKEREQVEAAWQTAVKQTLFSAHTRFQHEFEVVVHGTAKWLMATIAPEYNELGEHAGYIGTLADISQQKQAEAFLRYGTKMESLDLFAGAIAHDYNNMLMAMMGQAAIAQYQLDRESPANIHIDKLTQTAERAADLTKKVLTYSGGQYFEPLPVALNHWLSDNEATLQALVPDNAVLNLQLAADMPTIHTDEHQVKQIVTSLLLNAVNAIAEQANGEIVIATEAVHVTEADVHLWHYTNTPLQSGLYGMLAVQDNGHGIAAENLAKIFDPFFTTTDRGKGLGLSTVLGAVRGHQGGIAVQSRLNEGTRIAIYFPAQIVAVNGHS